MNDTVSYNGRSIPVQFGGAYAPGVAAYLANGLGTPGNPLSISGGSSLKPVGAASVAMAQASVGVAASAIVAPRAGAAGTGRIALTLYNAGTATVYLGASAGVTPTNGMPLPAGASITLDTTAAIYGVAASGAQTIGVTETY
jgi:hypothetical protein